MGTTDTATAGSSGTSTQSAGDVSTQASGQSATGGATQTGNATADTGATGTTNTTNTDTDTWQPERAMALINKLRPFEDKAKALEKENATLAAKLQEIEDGKKSDLEKAQSQAARVTKQLEELQTQLRLRDRDSAIQSAVSKENAKYPDAMQKLVTDHEALVLDDKGVPTKDSLSAVIRLLRKEMPDMFKPADAGQDGEGAQTGQQNGAQGQGNQQGQQTRTVPGSGASTNAAKTGGAGTVPGYFTTTQIADREFWTANKDAILKAIREGRVVNE